MFFELILYNIIDWLAVFMSLWFIMILLQKHTIKIKKKSDLFYAKIQTEFKLNFKRILAMNILPIDKKIQII